MGNGGTAPGGASQGALLCLLVRGLAAAVATSPRSVGRHDVMADDLGQVTASPSARRTAGSSQRGLSNLPRGPRTRRRHGREPVGDLRDDTNSELAAFWSWRMHAACRTVDSALFFGGDGERPRARRRRERRAKAVCATCPVLLPCRAYALVRREAYGIWGGLSERDRARILGDRDPPSTAAVGGGLP